MKKEILLILIFILFPIINADVISINSGGNEEIIINPDTYIEGFFSCTPDTCSSLGYNCRTWSDGCGGTINCGSCAAGYTCRSGICRAVTITTPGAGGGGGFIHKEVEGLKIIPKQFSITMTANSTTSAKIDLYNIGKSELDIKVLTQSLEKIVIIDETSFILKRKKSKTLKLQITSPPKAGIYTGKIRFITQNKIQEIPFVLNVRSGLSLFDISLDIPEKNRIINIGEKLKGQITLIQAGIQEPMDVSLHYIIKDYNDNFYLEESETIMVNKQKSYEHEFNTNNLLPGDYVIGAEVIYEGGVATASYPFQVVEKKPTKIDVIYIALIFILITAIIVILLTIKHYKKLRLKYKKRK